MKEGGAFKMVLLGGGRVGKTSIALRFTKNQFEEGTQPTINASYLEKWVKVGGKDVKMCIWDTAGQEEYNSLAPIYYKDAIGAIVVFQITSTESFQQMKKWVEQLKQNASQDITLLIAGNKSDLQSLRKVDKKQAQKYAKKHQAVYFECSAKNGSNVNTMFLALAEKSVKVMNRERSQNRKGPRLTMEGQKSGKRKKECC